MPQRPVPKPRSGSARTLADDGECIANLATTAIATTPTCDRTGPRSEKLANAALEQGNAMGTWRRRKATELDGSGDAQTALHRRDIETKLDGMDRPLDRAGVQRDSMW